MNRLIRLFRTSIGRKLVVAVTGILLLGFLIAHLLGNLTILQGRDTMNAYAAWLKGHPLIWVARAGLLAIFVAHVVTAVRLALENRAARPVGYRRQDRQAAGLASRSVLLTGLTVLAFAVFHLLHFTFGVVDSEFAHLVDEKGRHDVYAMVSHSFSVPWITGAYVVAMALLGVHLFHGAKSAFQTWGINHESYNALIRGGSIAVVAALIFGNIAIPTLVFGGAIGASGGAAPSIVRSPDPIAEPGERALTLKPGDRGERMHEDGS